MNRNNDDNKAIINLLEEIKAQNAEQLAKIEKQSAQIDHLEKTATKKGAIAGAVAGGVSGGLMAIGVELIRAKLGF